ncbi:MAG: undecaprenyl/decaprenyl-phosphate alpha-N-acetylglucosaminyl 1-phosphate transferase [Treponema sp.]|nr:undecaprenyl/decaprenyl-phosphate alpha-N-acetylglucosaminyl 1-phosphate transferase [Treponema sp.]
MKLVLLIFIASVVLSTGAVSLILWLSHRKEWYDNVDERKIHSGNIPRLGGIGFASAFLLIIAGIAIAYGISGVNVLRYLPCVAAMGITLFSGAYDDFRPMLPRYKLILQLIASVCVIIPGFDFDRLLYSGGGFFTELGILTYPITLLWIIGITNAINLLDGVDGLAGGLSAIIVFFLGLIFYSFAGVSKAVLLCTCLFGVLIGFLIFNAPIPKAKIFMGDCGSQFLGLTFALLPLMKEEGKPSSLPVFYAAALLAIPIFDTTAAVWRRLRDGKKISDPDKSHLHHKLLNLGLSARGVDAVILGLQIIIGVLIFIAVHVEGLFSLLILGSVYLITLAFFTAIHYLNKAVNEKKTAS